MAVSSENPNMTLLVAKIWWINQRWNTLTSKIKERSINVKHYYALIEEAVEDGVNLIIASDGIMGNMIFRSVVLAAGTKSYGAVTLGMKEIYIDTSRSQNIDGFKKAFRICKPTFQK